MGDPGPTPGRGSQATGRARPRRGDIPACLAGGVCGSTRLGSKPELPSFPYGRACFLSVCVLSSSSGRPAAWGGVAEAGQGLGLWGLSEPSLAGVGGLAGEAESPAWRGSRPCHPEARPWWECFI